MFFKPVDLRSQKAMVEFLSNHFRYNTMNSWNNSTSYANNLKIYNLGLPREVEEKAWELLNVEEVSRMINGLLLDWCRKHDYQWQARFNGRSGGYLVLYQGDIKENPHKSHCLECGQGNFKLVPPINPNAEEEIRLMVQEKHFWTNNVIHEHFEEQIAGFGFSKEEVLKIIKDERKAIKSGKEMSQSNKCGVCGGRRVNYVNPPTLIIVHPGRSIDQGEDFLDWDIESLRDRTKLVQSFDQLCDDIIAELVRICTHYNVVEEEIRVPKTIKVLQEA